MISAEQKSKNEFTYVAAYYMIKQILAKGTVSRKLLERLNKKCAETMGCAPIMLG